jgi:hypothetical protein
MRKERAIERHCQPQRLAKDGLCAGRLSERRILGNAVGWYLVAMHNHDRAAAAAMARDYIGFLRNHHRPDGLAESWEWFNPDTGRNANPLYVATIDLPYGCLCESGLIDRKK